MVWATCELCDVFISCWTLILTGTHSLQRIQWWASDAMINFSKSWTNKLHLELSEGEYIFGNVHFRLNYSFKSCLSCRCWYGRRISDMHAFMFSKRLLYFDHVMQTRPLDCIKYHSSSLPEHIMSSLYSPWGRWLINTIISLAFD